MDPTNNPTPTPNPMPGSEPGSNPVPGAAAPGVTISPAPGAGFESMSSPTDVGMGGMPTPVNPVINPTGGGVGAGVVVDQGAPSPVDSTPAPANPVFQPSGNDMTMAATDPIMMPEPAPAPDPVEEELKAPMKAAGPVPGSIGSAVSMPADSAAATAAASPTDNPFNNDPKAQAQNGGPAVPADQAASGAMAGVATKSAKSKNNKTTLIILIAVAAVIVVALVVVLMMQMFGGGSGGSSSNNSGNTVAVDDNGSQNVDSDDIDGNSGGGNSENGNNGASGSGGTGTGTGSAYAISCTRPMNMDEILLVDQSGQSGSINYVVNFNGSDTLTGVTKTRSVYAVADPTGAEPISTTTDLADVNELIDGRATEFELPVNENGKILMTRDNIQMNYEVLDYVCEVL